MPLLLILALALALHASADTVTGEVISITDGDTLVVLVDNKEVKVRLAEIDTPERGQAWSNRAKQALSESVFRKQVTIDITDTDHYGRAIGKVWFEGRDINRELVSGGHAWVYKQYMTDPSLLENEAKARESRLGLWSQSDPIPPWEWRRGNRSQPVAKGKADDKCGTKKFCRDMVSCEEAKFYLNECGLSRLDGDSDGVPCESLCRR